MSIHINGHGRNYAVCDAEGCDENVIDLSPVSENAERVLRTFFGWIRVGCR
jgi:hypothetical protein